MVIYENSVKFEDAGIHNLIKLYHANECLWNLKSPHFRNRATKENAWRRISMLLADHLTVEQLKLQILSLRLYYANELWNIKKSKLLGYYYFPRKSYFEKLYFLHDSILPIVGLDLDEVNNLIGCDKANLQDIPLSEDNGPTFDQQLSFFSPDVSELLLSFRFTSGNDCYQPNDRRDNRPSHTQQQYDRRYKDHDKNDVPKKKRSDSSPRKYASPISTAPSTTSSFKRKVLTGKYKSKRGIEDRMKTEMTNSIKRRDSNQPDDYCYRQAKQVCRKTSGKDTNQFNASSTGTYPQQSGNPPYQVEQPCTCCMSCHQNEAAIEQQCCNTYDNEDKTEVLNSNNIDNVGTPIYQDNVSQDQGEVGVCNCQFQNDFNESVPYSPEADGLVACRDEYNGYTGEDKEINRKFNDDGNDYKNNCKNMQNQKQLRNNDDDFNCKRSKQGENDNSFCSPNESRSPKSLSYQSQQQDLPSDLTDDKQRQYNYYNDKYSTPSNSPNRSSCKRRPPSCNPCDIASSSDRRRCSSASNRERRRSSDVDRPNNDDQIYYDDQNFQNYSSEGKRQSNGNQDSSQSPQRNYSRSDSYRNQGNQQYRNYELEENDRMGGNKDNIEQPSSRRSSSSNQYKSGQAECELCCKRNNPNRNNKYHGVEDDQMRRDRKQYRDSENENLREDGYNRNGGFANDKDEGNQEYCTIPGSPKCLSNQKDKSRNDYAYGNGRDVKQRPKEFIEDYDYDEYNRHKKATSNDQQRISKKCNRFEDEILECLCSSDEDESLVLCERIMETPKAKTILYCEVAVETEIDMSLTERYKNPQNVCLCKHTDVAPNDAAPKDAALNDAAPNDAAPNDVAPNDTSANGVSPNDSRNEKCDPDDNKGLGCACPKPKRAKANKKCTSRPPLLNRLRPGKFPTFTSKSEQVKTRSVSPTAKSRCLCRRHCKMDDDGINSFNMGSGAANVPRDDVILLCSTTAKEIPPMDSLFKRISQKLEKTLPYEKNNSKPNNCSTSKRCQERCKVNPFLHLVSDPLKNDVIVLYPPAKNFHPSRTSFSNSLKSKKECKPRNSRSSSKHRKTN